MLKNLGVAMIVIGMASADSEGILAPVAMIAVGLLLCRLFGPAQDGRRRDR